MPLGLAWREDVLDKKMKPVTNTSLEEEMWMENLQESRSFLVSSSIIHDCTTNLTASSLDDSTQVVGKIIRGVIILTGLLWLKELAEAVRDKHLFNDNFILDIGPIISSDSLMHQQVTLHPSIHLLLRLDLCAVQQPAFQTFPEERITSQPSLLNNARRNFYSSTRRKGVPVM